MAGSPRSDDERRLALQVWTLQARRSPTETHRILHDEHGINVPIRTISRWAQREEWHAAARDLLTDIAPGMLEATGANLLQAAHDASAYLADVYAGRAAPDRDKMQPALALVDRLGFVPFSNPARAYVNPLARTVSTDRHAADADGLADLDTATLQRLASGIVDPDD